MEEATGSKEEQSRLGNGVGSPAEAAMDGYLRSQGLYRKRVAKDGSCLFRAVAEQVKSADFRQQPRLGQRAGWLGGGERLVGRLSQLHTLQFPSLSADDGRREAVGKIQQTAGNRSGRKRTLVRRRPQQIEIPVGRGGGLG